MAEAPARAIEEQQARAAAFAAGSWAISSGWEIEIELADVHPEFMVARTCRMLPRQRAAAINAPGASPRQPSPRASLPRDRPQRLIEILAVPQERSTQHAFLHGAQLSERAVAASVAERRTRFEPVHAEHVEREAQDEFRAVERTCPCPSTPTRSRSPIRTCRSPARATGSERARWRRRNLAARPQSRCTVRQRAGDAPTR